MAKINCVIYSEQTTSFFSDWCSSCREGQRRKEIREKGWQKLLISLPYQMQDVVTH